MAACCFGWFGAQRLVAYRSECGNSHGVGRRLAGWLDWREVLCLTVPFVVLVGAHLAFRLAYYGEWLPNTYYAKHVRPWYESGFRYYVAAALETGLYLLVPLAWAAMRQRWRARREIAYALPLLCIVVHMAGVMRIGGDVFEYRPLDFYWPALAVPAVAAILGLGSRLSGSRWSRGLVQSGGRLRRRACSLAIFVPVFFYASAVQGVLLWEHRKADAPGAHVDLDEENAKWLLAMPGMPALVAIFNDLRRQSVSRFVGRRPDDLATGAMAVWSSYERMERGLIPDDALTARRAIGVVAYYLPDLGFVDKWGLTDATIARNPVTVPNRRRIMAHDRTPPSGYLEDRGVNFYVRRPAASKIDALRHVNYAVRAAPGVWMPFNSPDHDWVVERFSGHGLAQRAQSLAGWSATIESAEPDIRSDFNVYYRDGHLLYAGHECEDVEPRSYFFLHVFPVDRNDLPASRRQYMFDNLDFRFGKRDLSLDAFVEDVLASSAIRCAAVVELPSYEISRIRTGQPGLWEGEFEVAGRAP